MNVLLTFGAGYISNHHTIMLLVFGHKIHIAYNLSRGNETLVKWEEKNNASNT